MVTGFKKKQINIFREFSKNVTTILTKNVRVD